MPTTARTLRADALRNRAALIGAAAEVFDRPRHPYTQALMAAARQS